MPPHESGRTLMGAARNVLMLAWMTALILAAIANPALTYPGRDGGIFLYAASRLLRGGVPYVDVWENKGPLVFFLNAFGLLVGDGSRWGVWLVEVSFLLASAVLLWRITRRLAGEMAALVGGSLLLAAAAGVLQGGNFSEEYSLLFSLLGATAFGASLKSSRAGYPLLLGATLGFNLLLRPNLISVQAAALLAYMLLGLRLKEWGLLARRLGWAVAGAAAVVAPVIAYFAAHDALDDMYRVVILFNLQYSGNTGPGQFLDGIVSAARALGVFPVLLAAAGYAASVFSLLRRAPLDEPSRQFLLLPVIGWPTEIALSSLSGRNYLHYFIPWAIYVGLAGALLVGRLLQRWQPRLDRFAPLLALALLVPAGLNMGSLRGYADALSGALRSGGRLPEYRDPVARYVEVQTLPEESVFIWGFRPIVNFVSGRDAPAAFLPYPLVHVDTELGQGFAEQFYVQFTDAPPALVINMILPGDRERIPDLDPAVREQQSIRRRDVVLAENLRDMFDFIEANYSLVGTLDGHTVYRLRPVGP